MANTSGLEMPRGSKSGVLTKEERLRKTETERENQVLLNKMLSIMNRPHPLSTSHTLVHRDPSKPMTPTSIRGRPGSYMRQSFNADMAGAGGTDSR